MERVRFAATIFDKPATPPPVKPKPAIRGSVRLNKNFLNYPLARDPKRQAQWLWDGQPRAWVADLPGRDRVGAGSARGCP